MGKWTELHISQAASFFGQTMLTAVLPFPPAAELGGAGCRGSRTLPALQEQEGLGRAPWAEVPWPGSAPACCS